MITEAFYTAPNGISVAFDTIYAEGHTTLRVLSACCGNEIHFAGITGEEVEWTCYGCKAMIFSTPGGWASVYVLDSDEDRYSVAEWLSYWIGARAEDVEVSIG